MGQFLYPASNASTMMINAGGSVNGNSNSKVTINPAADEVTGSAESVVGCGSNPYVVYFAAKFDRSFASYGTWNGNAVNPGSTSSGGQYTGAFVVFDTSSNRVVRVQVGVSFVSVANAQLNLASEGADFNLASVAENAASAWNAYLNTIHVRGGTQNETATFYTALYHTFFQPNIFSDVNGQYLGFDGSVHTVPNGHIQYENIPGWDAVSDPHAAPVHPLSFDCQRRRPVARERRPAGGRLPPALGAGQRRLPRDERRRRRHSGR